MEILKKIFKQTSWQILGKIVSSISTIIILGLVTRSYGEKGTGLFTLALTYLGIFYLLADFGFNAHVLKKVQSKEWNKLFGTRLVWSFVLAIVAIVLLPFWSFATAEFSLAVLIGSLAIMLSGVFVSCNFIFQSKLRYDLSVLASTSGVLFSLLAYMFLISLKVEGSLLLLAHSSSWILIAVTSLFLVYRVSSNILPIFDMKYAVSLFKDSWPIAATLALNVVYFRADSFIVASFKGIADAGLYNVAFSVFQSALVLPSFIMNAYYPLMLKSLKGIKAVGLGLFLLSILGTITTIFFAPQFIQIITGSGFEGSVKSLQILALGFPAYFLSALLMWVLVTKGNYKKMLLIYFIGLVFNLILNFYYIPQSSYIAASYITVISEYLILILLAVSLLL